MEAKNQQIMHFCCRKAKNSCFAPKTLIYGIFVANVNEKHNIRIKFWENLLMRTSRKLWRPVKGGGGIPVYKNLWSEFCIFWRAFGNIKLTLKDLLRLELSQNKSKVFKILVLIWKFPDRFTHYFVEPCRDRRFCTF